MVLLILVYMVPMVFTQAGTLNLTTALPQTNTSQTANVLPSLPDEKLATSGKLNGDIIPEANEFLRMDSLGTQHRSSFNTEFKQNLAWPNAIIPYQFNLHTSFAQGEKDLIHRVMSQFAAKSCIRWVPKTAFHKGFVLITKNQYYGCASHVGYKPSMRILSLDHGCFSYGTIFHEMMHSAGFFHEQSRHDRDDFVEIHWENLDQGVVQNFKKRKFDFKDPANSVSPYDYGSLMHYSETAFSKNGKPTIVPKSNSARIGQRVRPSDIDIWEMNRMYNCPNNSLASRVTLPPWSYTTTRLPPPRALPFYCAFEKGMCGFMQPWKDSDELDWLRKEDQVTTNKTLKSPTDSAEEDRGFYMTMDSKGRPGARATMISPILTSSTQKYCLTFTYRITGAANVLHVYEQNRGGRRHGIWYKMGDTNGQWSHASVNRTRVSFPFKVVFEAVTVSATNKNQNKISVDDVSITPCEKQTVRLPFYCNFEMGWCNLVQDYNDQFDWKLDRTPDGRRGGILGDHTSGSGFYAVASSRLQNQNDRALLLTGSFNPQGQFCISFYYNIFGPVYEGRLSAFIRSVDRPHNRDYLYQFEGVSTHRHWRHAFATRTSNTDIQIGFEATALGKQHDFAIDDFDIAKGPCPFAPVATQRPFPTIPTLPPRSVAGDIIFPEIDGYFRFEGNCPRNILRRCNRANCPSVRACARLCSGEMLCEGISFIFDEHRPDPCLLKRRSCPTGSTKWSHNVRFYKKKDNCVNSLCANGGRCESLPNGYRCRCPRGFRGKFCHKEDTCAITNHCQNGGSCRYGPTDTAYCVCAPGFEGSRCQIDKDDCASLPCVHGICQDGPNTYHCTCWAGYKGPNCEQEEDECKSQPCLNNGQCIDKLNGYDCRCNYGYRGKLCEQRVIIPGVGLTANHLPFSCNFDHSLCGFQQNKDDNFDWIQHSGRTSTIETGPTYDHTMTTNGSGKYIYIESSYPRKLSDVARLTSPLLRADGPTCITFYWHMFGSQYDMGWLKAYAESWNGIRRLMWKKTGVHGNRWNKAQFTWHTHRYMKIVLEGVTGYGFQGDMAIDDLQVTSGSCERHAAGTTVSSGRQHTPNKGDVLYECDFNLDNCGFIQNNNDAFDWTRHIGATPSDNTGPSFDHTTSKGSFLYAEASFPQKPKDRAIITSPYIHADGPTCVQFYYHMWGQGMGTMDVHALMTNRYLVWSKSGDQGNYWKGAEFELKPQGAFQIEVTAARGASFESDIAIDDITILKGPCNKHRNDKLLNCNFDKDMCGFEEEKGLQTMWARQQYILPGHSSSPSADHTSGHGHYIFDKPVSTRKTGDIGRILSPIITSSNGACIEFYYQSKGNRPATLTLYLLQNQIKRYLWQAAQQANNWQFVQLSLPPNANFKIGFETIRISSKESMLAIDDLVILNKPCIDSGTARR